jgi:hypothetical protein
MVAERNDLVMRGLDPRIHLEESIEDRWIAGSSPAMTVVVVRQG